MDKILPTTQILISAGASIIYFCGGDIRRGFYWLGAVVITAAVTF